MAILEALVESSVGLGVSDVARRTDLPKTTAARILSDLAGAGMLERVREHYVPGLRLLALVGQVEPAGVLARQRVILPQLDRLREETGLAVAFSTLRHGRVRFEAALYVNGAVDRVSPVQHWVPAHCTCSGKVLLAFTPHAERRYLPDRPQTAYTASTITHPQALAEELRRIRDAGVARNDGEYVPEVSGLAVPVFGARSALVGALAVCGAHNDVSRKSVWSALRQTAVELNTPVR
ncbi:MAG TPA: IclR family transcriptional regulator [Actinophytocola sp.]|uniref:IclR family transcriptional regulator n=1 Tax=Actinophytocola sp. TaxID=1872138 RepID=UPI002DBC32A1|nr:IclR family transcriptional regulator [Actinophytocola sp.]HEU5471957.1 IclR family transcriptional regulator [Actinophytocola sp.]